MATATYEAVTRSDLAGYDQQCVDLAMEAVDLGWTGRMSSKGHFILRAPDGETTMSVSRSSNGRSLANMRANLARWKRKEQSAQLLRAVEQGHDEWKRDVFIEHLARALESRTEEALDGDAADVMRTVYGIVLDREEIAQFAYDLAKNDRISDFGWLSGHPDDTSELRAWNVNWAVFDRRDGRVIDVGGPRVAPTGETWDREFVEVKVAEQLVFERKRARGEVDEDLVGVPIPNVSADRPFVCEICDRTFKGAHHLGRHMSTIHKPEPKFVSTDEPLFLPSEVEGPVSVEMDETLTIVADLHVAERPSNQIGRDEVDALAAAEGMTQAIDGMSLVAARMAMLEAERGGYDARLQQMRREYEDVVENLQQQVADLTAERDTARDSLAALKQIVSDL